jgi:formamidopyrimidine-DNA glycosylase
MPELPEVETMRRGIAGLTGGRIVAARFPAGRCRPLAISPSPTELAVRLDGTRIGSVARHGKRLAIGIEGEGLAPQWLVIEPRMTGLLLVAEPPTPTHVRMELDIAPGRGHAPGRHRTLLFWDQRGLGTIRLVDAAGLERACGAAKLGPDGLVVTGEELAGRLGRSRREVKVALLDQSAVAGIGNIYAAEILHRAAIDPRTPCPRLSAAAWDAVAGATREILATAVVHEGSSIGDELYRTADNRKGGFQKLHRVYGLAGSRCQTCGGTISRIVQAQRSTFLCATCQPPIKGKRRRAPRPDPNPEKAAKTLV